MAKEETREENKQLPIVANGRGLVLRNIDDMWRFACAVVKSEIAPSGMRKPEQILVAIQTGAELGMGPMRALQSICVINGAARLYGDAPLALVRQSGELEFIKEWIDDDMTAHCETKRKGDPESIERTFSVKDAKVAGLWAKKGPWQQYPKRMLQMRARSLNLRDVFPDAFGGATIAEEYMGAPEPAYEPDTPRRADRKPAEDVTVSDVANTCEKTLIAGLFRKLTEKGYAPTVDSFAELSAKVCGADAENYLTFEGDELNPSAYNNEKLTAISQAIEEMPEVANEPATN
jgi:hypothetical protein